MPSAACAIRGSVCWVAASGGGVHACDSHILRDRNCGSLATSWPNAVVPVRGQPDDEYRTADDLVVDLWVLLVGVDDPEPLDQRVADGGVLDDVAQVVEPGFGVQRVDGAFQPSR